MDGKKKKLKTVLTEIKYLRNMNDFLIDQRNSNRYRVMVKETLGHTAYCFSTPIYNADTKKLVQLDFSKTKNGYSFTGTSGIISVCQSRCVFENHDGKVVISLKDAPMIQGENDHNHSLVTVAPTLNGLRFIVKGKSLSFSLKSEINQDSVRFHPTCFSIMKESFKPFLSIATLYASDGQESYSPVEIKYSNQETNSYELELFHEIKDGSFLFEINLYEPKLFQDTTVESAHPDANNVYGAVGFIGRTNQFGEQWLYSRPDFSKIPDLTSRHIDKVLLHIPILNGSTENVSVSVPQKRFCSFGSTWNSKIMPFDTAISSNNMGRYLTIDVTASFINHSDHMLIYNEGLILKKPKGKNHYIAISTGDCYSAPQILEIKFI